MLRTLLVCSCAALLVQAGVEARHACSSGDRKSCAALLSSSMLQQRSAWGRSRILEEAPEAGEVAPQREAEESREGIVGRDDASEADGGSAEVPPAKSEGLQLAGAHAEAQGMERRVGHHDSAATRNGIGVWVITLEHTCTTAELRAIAQHMPPRSAVEFFGDPSRGGICVFMMRGTRDQLQEKLGSQAWPSAPTAEAALDWQAVPEIPLTVGGARDADDSAVEPNPPPSWGLDRIDNRHLDAMEGIYAPPHTGSGVHVYVLDTGIRTSHRDLGGRAVPTLEVLSGTRRLCDAADAGCAADLHGHGTHCAGTIGGRAYGVAKGAVLHSVKVLDDTGAGSSAWFVDALDWVMTDGIRPAVVSAALGGLGASSSVAASVDAAVAAGITVVVAAGNHANSDNPHACDYTPASAPAAITVGASSRTDNRGYFSCTGHCVDIYAPGVSVSTIGVSSDMASATLSSTSMASAHVAGAAALLLQEDGNRTPADVLLRLTSMATRDALIPQYIVVPNLLLYTGVGEAPTPAPTPRPTPAPTPSPPTPAPTPPPTPAPTPSPSPVARGACSWEQGFGGNCSIWSNHDGDDFDWQRGSGRTPSSQTGPGSAYDGSFYMYIEASAPRRQGDVAVLGTPPLSTDGPTAMTFWYHMYGAGIGRLEVLSGGSVVWSETGDQGAAWRSATVAVADGAELAFRATRGPDYRGDIALDLVEFGPLVPTPAPTPAPLPAAGLCSFEDEMQGPCGACGVWYGPANDLQHSWTRHSGATPSDRTGPAAAAEGSYYMHIEASSPRTAGDAFVLRSHPLLLAGPTALGFKYHMYGATVGTLEVQVDGATLWRESGDQGNAWRQAAVDLSELAGRSVEVSFVARRGASWTGDIAIDLVRFDAVAAASGSDSFETAEHPSDFDLWYNAGGDDFDWLRHSGPTPSAATGPAAASDGSHYMYIEASHPRRAGDSAVLRSRPVRVPDRTALGFSYHMLGAAVGSLEVVIDGARIWSETGDQGGAWRRASVDLSQFAGGVVEISFVGTCGAGFAGDIAIDALAFSALGGQ